MARKYEDDVYDHLESDIDKIRVKYRMYISASNSDGAHSVVNEIISNSLDECRTPRSPGNKIHIEFDERSGFIEVEDNGRGIPLNILEDIYTNLNYGSNINTANKNSIKAETLGQNGTGSLAICGLAEHVEITSNRGGTENKFKTLIFEEGKKINENEGKCASDKHGMYIKYKPSKVMGKKTYIVWNDVHKDLSNLKYLLQKKIAIDSVYYDENGNVVKEKYQQCPFEDILDRNNKEEILGHKIKMSISDDNIMEDLNGESLKRYMNMDVAFIYTSSLNPYIDSFSNSNNTTYNGDHLDGALEALCRYLQTATKNSLTDREKDKLDIKWDDVKNGLSIAVSLRTNYEQLYTNQSKYKVESKDFKKIIIDLMMEELNTYFEKNPNQLKETIGFVKMNARARREGEKVRSAVVKNTLTNWSSYKMKNFDPCTNKGKAYKEIFIIEGDKLDVVSPKIFRIAGTSPRTYHQALLCG